jgi:hypothetical protein
MTRTATAEKLLNLRVLTEFNQNYKVYVSRCLETGHVVTADCVEIATDMMGELLTDEITFAIRHENLPNLLSDPSPLDVWTRWLESSRNEDVERRTLHIDANNLRFGDESNVSIEVAFANSLVGGTVR